MSEELFEMPATTPQAHDGTGWTCGKCVHSIRPHFYRPDWLYCEKTPSKATQGGIMKVKSRRAACPMFQEGNR